jgi:hypothetical protein
MTSKGHRAAVYGTCIAAAIVLLLVRYRETLWGCGFGCGHEDAAPSAGAAGAFLITNSRYDYVPTFSMGGPL